VTRVWVEDVVCWLLAGLVCVIFWVGLVTVAEWVFS
jgi:hypothetical protein